MLSTNPTLAEPPQSENGLNDMINAEEVYYFMIVATSFLLMVLLLWHVGHAFFKRLWLLPSHPSRLLGLNAGTLALLGIVAKPDKPRFDTVYNEFSYMLLCTVLICTVVGAFMPSTAASADLRDMWSNVIGVGVLIVSANFTLFLQIFFVPESSSAPNTMGMEQTIVTACLFLLLLVLLVQAVALEAMMSDVKAIVLEQLEQLRLEAIPGYKAIVMVERPAWSWEVVEHNSCIKLMMVVTSNPQHVMARSPSTAIVGALAITCIMMPVKVSAFVSGLHTYEIILSGLICVWRWARVALQEDRPFLSLVSGAEPSYWRRKVNNARHTLKAGPSCARPNVLKEGIHHSTAFLMLCFLVPPHRLLVAMIRFTHILSALVMQKIIWLPIKALKCSIVEPLLKRRRVVDTVTEASKNFDSLGVICLEGEDACIVRREFAGVVNLIIKKQLKRAKTKSDLKALISLVQRSKSTSALAGKSTSIYDILHQDGAPYVANLHVEHGYQYGWSLTLVSLLAIMTKVEALALGTLERSAVAMDAYWQAKEMIQLIDEQFGSCIVCSKETYACASATEWSKLAKEKRRWFLKRSQVRQLDAVDQVLKAVLEPLERHMKEFNKTRNAKSRYIATAWPQQTIVCYTMHTVSRNMLLYWTDMENATNTNTRAGGGDSNAPHEIIKSMVEHMNDLIAEVITCCLCNLPTALDMSMTEAVLSGSLAKIEKGLVLVGQGKHLWEKLQWPLLYSPKSRGLGQLRQWIHLAEVSNACAT